MKFVWCAYFVILPTVKCFFSYCDKNESLLIPKGSSATFSAEPATPFQSLRLYKFNETRYHIFHVYPYRRLYNRHFENNETRYRMFDFYSNAAFHFNDPWIENKTRVTGDLTNITITIHDLEKEDNGTYVLHLRDTICFVLFVVGINKEPVGPIEEHSPAYFYAYPKASVINRPIINATMIWLVDGKDITQSPLFVIQDGMIWLASVSRSLDRRNVTYRAVQDNGIVTEVNYTIDVLYGPEEPLEFSPDTDHYFLTSGNIMPEISCSVNCSPLCNVSWNTHGTGNILSIGKVRSSLTGTYTCTATRPGTDVVVKRRLIVQVEDTSAFTIAVAVLASIQAVTTTILVIFGIFIYTRSNASPCKSSKNSYPRDNGDRETSPGQINEESDINDIAQEQYEELTSEVRNDPNHEYYERLKTAGKNDEILYYENTKKARY